MAKEFNDFNMLVEFFISKGLNYEQAKERADEMVNGNLPQKQEKNNLSKMTDEEIQKQFDDMNSERIKRLEFRLAKEKQETDTRIGKLETDVNERMTVDYGQQQALLNAKNTRVEKLWRNDEVNKELHDTKRKVHARAWTDLKNAFGVSSYRDIREKDFDEAINYINYWRPRMV